MKDVLDPTAGAVLGRRFVRRGSILASTLVLLAAGAFAQKNSDCLDCHADKSLTMSRRGGTISVFVDQAAFVKSVHGAADCIACHADLAG
ncbi:MAG: hypothetical protein FJY80_09585 [Candidatus Aminicenantes bacterium]|nr:hypothetical protein [Candidatus Aminicenantes bacterium]